MAIVVSDTSPIRALDHLGLLDLLPRLFDEVILPPAVLDELENPRPRFVPIDLTGMSFVRRVAPSNLRAVEDLRILLDAGEAEAIVVAEELNADRLLMDERSGRRVARTRGLRPLGVLGLLVRSKRLGLVPAFTPLLDRLQNDLGFYVSAELRIKLRKQARETP